MIILTRSAVSLINQEPTYKDNSKAAALIIAAAIKMHDFKGIKLP